MGKIIFGIFFCGIMIQTFATGNVIPYRKFNSTRFKNGLWINKDVKFELLKSGGVKFINQSPKLQYDGFVLLGNPKIKKKWAEGEIHGVYLKASASDAGKKICFRFSEIEYREAFIYTAVIDKDGYAKAFFSEGIFAWNKKGIKNNRKLDLADLQTVSFTFQRDVPVTVMEIGFIPSDSYKASPAKNAQNRSFSNRTTDDIEAQKLLSLSLAKSHEEKLWPEKLRGIHMPAYIRHFPTDKLFKKLKSWNVNVVRLGIQIDPKSSWDIKKGSYPPLPANDPMAPYKKNIEGLRIALALAQKYHIYIIPTVHRTMRRGFDDFVAKENVKAGSSAQAVLQEKYWCEFVSELESFWIYIAENFGDHPWLLGYDLLNEPHTPKEVALQNELFTRITHRIRSVDKNTWVIIEPGPWSLPDQAYPSTLTPIKDHKIIYSMHFYYPHTYTHQGISIYTGPEFVNKPYPGILKLFPGKQHLPKYWDKAALENSMKNVIAFQKKYNVKIFVGEFSVLRRAPGAAQWLADVVDIFEKYHWSWTFHGIGYMWNGWNPTFGTKDPENSEPDGGKITDSLKVLLKAWSQNKAK